MRYLLCLLAIGSGMVIGLHSLRIPPTPLEGAAVLALAAPRSVVAGERYSAYGGLLLPEGTYAKRFHYCGSAGCVTKGWGTVSGPGEWWGFLGQFEADVPGSYEAELILYDRSGMGVQRAVTRHAWTIDVE